MSCASRPLAVQALKKPVCTLGRPMSGRPLLGGCAHIQNCSHRHKLSALGTFGACCAAWEACCSKVCLAWANPCQTSDAATTSCTSRQHGDHAATLGLSTGRP